MSVTLTTNAGAVIATIGGRFNRSLPKGKFSISRSGENLLLQYPLFHSGIKIDVTTTLDGVTYATIDELAEALAAFSDGGTGQANGVQTVTGDLVDNTDPNNPIVEMPTGAQILVNGVSVPNGGLINGVSVESLLFNYGNAINELYIRVPELPTTGTYVLKSIEGTATWVEEV